MIFLHSWIFLRHKNKKVFSVLTLMERKKVLIKDMNVSSNYRRFFIFFPLSFAPSIKESARELHHTTHVKENKSSVSPRTLICLRTTISHGSWPSHAPQVLRSIPREGEEDRVPGKGTWALTAEKGDTDEGEGSNKTRGERKTIINCKIRGLGVENVECIYPFSSPLMKLYDVSHSMFSIFTTIKTKANHA